MGVLPCDRVGCDGIMCDFLSYKFGYLCRDCLEELIAGGMSDIRSFMGTRSRGFEATCEWENLVREEFKDRHGDY